MPLVHFFETSFGRTTHRRIILVEVDQPGRFRMGRGHLRRESVLQRRVDRRGLDDRARLRRAARAEASLRERSGSRRPERTHSRPLHGSRRSGSRGVGSGSAVKGRASVGTHRRRLVQRDRLRRVHRNSELGSRPAEDHRERSRRRVISASRSRSNRAGMWTWSARSGGPSRRSA